MNQNDFLLRLAFKYGTSKENSSGHYRGGPYRDGRLYALCHCQTTPITRRVAIEQIEEECLVKQN